jgi:hypothetical protein
VSMTVCYDSKEVRDKVLASPMKEGIESGYDILEGILNDVQAIA